MKTLFCFLCAAGFAGGTFSQMAQADSPIVQPAPTMITVTASKSATAEGSSEPAIFTIKRTGPTGDSLLVSYRTSGSAVNGIDYNKLPGSVLIPAGAASVDLPVAAIDDKIAEEEESVVLTLVSPIQPLAASGVSILLGYEIGNPASAVISIKDNDADVKLPTVSIAATVAEAMEEGPKNGEFTVSRFAGTDGALVVEYEIVTDSITWPLDGVLSGGAAFPIFLVPAAQNGKDYKTLSRSVLIPMGAKSAKILVEPINDQLVEGREHVTLRLKANAAYNINAPDTATVFIVNSSVVRPLPPKVAIEAPHSGDKFAEHTEIKVQIGTADADGYVPRIELFDGDKLIASEQREFFVKPPPGQLETFEFLWKDASAGKHRLVARAIDDAGVTGESAAVEIEVLGLTTATVVTIKATTPETLESGASDPGRFTVSRAGSTRTKLNVHYLIAGTAQNGIDYNELSGTVTIAAGENSATILIKPVPDKVQEGNETVTLTIEQRIFVAPPSEEDYVVGDPKSATVVIVETPTNANQPPKVAIVSPKNGDEFPFQANIEIDVAASDPDGKVREVAFYADDRLLGRNSNPTFHFVWKEVPAGKHELRAQATDDDGASTMSEAVTIHVRERGPVAFVTRGLPDFYTPGETLKVVLEASPADLVQVYAVEDRPPKGWTVGNISEGGIFDAASREVKFGPFFDNKARAFNYEVTPPANESGAKEFAGVASANGVDSTIGGDHVIAERSTRHPADIEPGDNRIAVQELTAYALAWKTGKDWSVGPNPIPQSYVTRAGEIWRQGETYTYDPAQGPAPLWWVPKKSAALLAAGSAMVAAPEVSASPGSALRSFVRTGAVSPVVYLVTVKVLPKTGVNAYTVEERPPDGWAVSDTSNDGAFDEVSGKIRWGIFLDDQARTLTYRVTPAADQAHRHAVFEGIASFDGIDVPVHSDKEANPGEANGPGGLTDIHRHSTGEFEVSFSGEAGHRYKIQVSTNLVDWIDFGQVVNEAGEMQMLDTDATNSPVRYYRAILSD